MIIPEVGRIGYLSGAPRVSTREIAELSGPRAHVLGLISGLHALGWTVRRFIMGDCVPESWVRAGSEKQLTRTRFNSLAADVIRLALGRVAGYMAWRRLEDVDFVYERCGVFQAVGRAFQAHGIPWVLESNAILHKEAGRQRGTLVMEGLARRIEGEAYRDCNAVVCVTASLRDSLITEFDLPPRKVLVVHNGVDPNQFDPSTVKPIRLSPFFTLGFVGSAVAWQGLDVAVDSIALLRRAGCGVTFVIVGDGPETCRLRARAKSLGLTEAVLFAGRVSPSDVPRYIAGFDACYCGHYLPREPAYFSPLKLYEYLAMAKPVLLSQLGAGLAEMEQSEAVFPFEAGNSRDLARAVRTAIACAEQLPARGMAGRVMILQKHSWKARAEQMLRGVRGILGELG